MSIDFFFFFPSLHVLSYAVHGLAFCLFFERDSNDASVLPSLRGKTADYHLDRTRFRMGLVGWDYTQGLELGFTTRFVLI